MGILTTHRRAMTIDGLGAASVMQAGRLGAAVPYRDKVLGYSPISYWMLAEAAGITALCEVDIAQNGTYYGASLGEPPLVAGYTSVYFPGGDPGPTESSCDIYSLALNAIFNGNTGSVAGWFRWDGDILDGNHQRLLWLRAIDGPSNRYITVMIDGGTQSLISWAWPTWTQNLDIMVPVDLTAHHVAVTWGVGGATGYLDGVPIDTSPYAGGWTGNLHAWNCTLASDYFDGDSFVNFTGWLAHWALWDSVLPGPAVLDLATA